MLQAQVAAALASGVESGIGGGYGRPQSQELSGGIGPAEGLFQFEPGTWTGGAGGGKNGLPSTVDAATWQQQVQGFINDTGGPGGSNFGAWGPDLVAARGDPNSASNPAYGYSGAPQPGSEVYGIISKNAAAWAQNMEPGTAAGNPAGAITGSGGGGSPVTASTAAFGGPLNPANWTSEAIDALKPWVGRIVLVIVALILLKVGIEKLFDTDSTPLQIAAEPAQDIAQQSSSKGMAAPVHPVRKDAEHAGEAAALA